MLAKLTAILTACAGIIRGVNSVADKLNTVIANQGKIMAELDDLKTAQANLTAAVAAGTAEITALVTKVLALIGAPTGVDPAAVEAAAKDIQAQADAMNAGVAAAKTQAGV
jgi:peptidoglycan hydrolase CwlO-like protein